MDTFADRLRFLRRQTVGPDGKPLSQEKLARALDVSFRTYALWETGKSEPEIKGLLKLNAYYGKSIDWLLKGEE